MRKRILSLALTVTVLLSLLPAGALEAWAAVGEPTEISTVEGLKQLAGAAADSSFILTADIELPADWSPVEAGYNENLSLDGNGYTITLDGAPLFGNMGDYTVSNLILDGSVSSDNSIASLATGGRGIVRNCVSYADVTYTGAAGSDWFAKYAAGFANYTASGGSMSNCVYAGVLTPGAANAYGALVNIDFYDVSVTNCVAVGSDRIGTKTGMSVEVIPTGDSNTLLFDTADFDPERYVGQLNANRDAAAGDLEWEIQSGRLALKHKAEEPGASDEEIAALRDAVDRGADGDKIYTAESFRAYSEALTRAEAILAQDVPKQNAVVNATAALNTAYSGLAGRALGAVDLTGQEVVSITSAGQLESLTAGKYYRLDTDIEISGMWFGTFETMNAVLDGNGHTITLNTSNHSCLWSSLGPDAVVQNLGILGSVTYSTHSGAIASSSEGLIVNCWSRADVTPGGNVSAGGLVGTLKSGGAIVNCYVSGSITSSGNPGVFAGNIEKNSLIQSCYGLTDNFAGAGEGAVRDCAVKARKDFYSAEFLALLNQNRGAYGREWTLSAEGYPHLGAAESYTPPEALNIAFTYLDGRTVTFKSDEGLTVSLQDASGYAVGKFSMEGAARWQDTIVGNKDTLLVNENGTLNIYQTGSAEVVAISSEADGSKELVRFTVTVVQGDEIDGLRLTLGGADIGDSLTLQGSEQVTLVPEILRGTVWSPVSASQVEFSHTGALHRVNGTIYAEEPGEMTLSAKYMDRTATVKITSVFVPVTSIQPSPSGTYIVHQRNTNAQPLGAFINLSLSDNAGTVTVLPENASYRDKWTMTSSDDSVAEYVSSMLLAVLPKKAGTVTLTAVVEADGQQPRVQGSSEIAIVYKNPVETVAIAGDRFTVKEREELPLPIIFSGSKSSEGLRVTEPAMNWSFASNDGGEVEIITDGSPIVSTQLADGALLCEANDKYKMIGVTEGTVTVTGIPVDQTRGAEAVTFTVTVESGAPVVPADNAALAAAGIANAQSYLMSDAADYSYGNEWEIFSLRRSGQTIPQEKLEEYRNAVERTYKNNPDATAMKPTTIARVALTLGAMGENAADFRGLDFIKMLYTSIRIGEGGNEPMWALIALESRDYAVPAGALWTRDKLVTELIANYQTPDGGFGLNDNRTASVDMTAMAIQALAPYYNARQDVKESVDKALAYLKGQMNSNCGFQDNAESAAQVIIALTELGLDPTDSRNGFVRNAAVNLLTNLTGFAHEDGGYKHYSTDQGAQPMSTTQALLAFESYRRLTAGESGLYDLTDAADARSVLTQRLAEANALKESDYTEETWAALQKAIGEARLVLDDAASDEAALKAADTALAAALAGLKGVSSGGGDKPDIPQSTIKVTFRLVGDTRHDSPDEHNKYVNWIRTTTVTVPDGATVYDAFKTALKENGMRFEENQSDYISGIQAPSVLGGHWLREFDNGPQSGWKYMVNGKYPNVGLRYYWLKKGDSIVWRYVDDYTDDEDNTTKWKEAADVEPSASGTGSSGSAVTPEGLPGEDASLSGKLPFTDVAATAWYHGAVQYVYEKKLFSGTAAAVFSPENEMDRAMVVTVLYNLAGRPEVSGGSGFADVKSSDYYADAVAWASKNEIVSGYSSGRFGGGDVITREQLAVILYHYAELMKYDTAAANELSGYRDASEISSWALPAMKWANAKGLITGRTASTLAPAGTATRAETAAVLMHFMESVVK